LVKASLIEILGKVVLVVGKLRLSMVEEDTIVGTLESPDTM
jgi:hypothetical protein